MGRYSSMLATGVSLTLVLCLLVSLPVGAEGKSCVFSCMKNFFPCKRMAALASLVEGDTAAELSACCATYQECFQECKPEATKLPPCNAGTRKRGSWDKREHRQEQQPARLFRDFF